MKYSRISSQNVWPCLILSSLCEQDKHARRLSFQTAPKYKDHAVVKDSCLLFAYFPSASRIHSTNPSSTTPLSHPSATQRLRTQGSKISTTKGSMHISIKAGSSIAAPSQRSLYSPSSHVIPATTPPDYRCKRGHGGCISRGPRLMLMV